MAFAHSGCCSWHGGVRGDGCGCNDGTPLSSTCAPYYTCTAAPQQNTAPVGNSSPGTTTNTYTAPIYTIPTNTPMPIQPSDTPTPTPTVTPTLKPTEAPTQAPTAVPTTAVLGSNTTSNGFVAFLLVILAPIIIIGSLWWGKKISK